MVRLKIAQVAASDSSIRFLLLDQMKALQKIGHEVTAICGPGPWVEQIRRQGIKVEVINMAREPSPVRDLKSLGALYRCFRKHNFDVIHSHTPKAGLLGPLAATLARAPMVVHTIHGLLFHDRMPIWKQWVFWLPEKFTALFSNYLLSQSKEDINRAIKTKVCSARKILYLGNGIDLTRFAPDSNGSDRRVAQELGIREEDFVVGSVGRLVYEKGFAELFAAAEKIVTRHSNVKFLIVGPQECDQSDAVNAELIESLTRRGVVLFVGWRNDMPKLYSMMDVFVLPSHREGVPRACMEAAAMRRPIIATDIRGCREVVRHGETGLLVPMKNADAVAKAIEELLLNPSLRLKMGERGRRHILENFDNKVVLERLLKFYAMIGSHL